MKKTKRKKVTKKSAEKHLHEFGLKTSFGVVMISFLMMTIVVINQDSPRTGVQLSMQNSAKYLKTSIENDDNRSIIPNSTGDASASTNTTETVGNTESTTNTTNQSSTNQSNVAPAKAPSAGMPENIIIGFAVVLGLLGAATFFVLKRGDIG